MGASLTVALAPFGHPLSGPFPDVRVGVGVVDRWSGSRLTRVGREFFRGELGPARKVF